MIASCAASGVRIAVLSVDAELAAVLGADPGPTRVHSVFEHVINIIDGGGRLFSLAAAGLDDAPWTLRADLDRWTSTSLRPGRPVIVGGGRLVIPDVLELSVDDARLWYTNQLPPVPPEPGELRTVRDALDAAIRVHGVSGGALPAVGAGTVARAVSEAVVDRGRRLGEALVAGDRAGAQTATRGLIGLGSGLTPAGDDFLSGLLLSAARPGSGFAGYQEIAAAVLDGADGQTTELSLQTLREALRGRTRQRIADLLTLTAAPAGPRRAADLADAAARVAAIGHTSGTDILAGLRAGLDLELRLKGSP